MDEKIYGSNGLSVPMPKVNRDASGSIPFDKEPPHIEDAKNTLAKAQELLKSEELSFDKTEKLQAAIDDLDIAVDCDADDEFEVGNKARALRKVVREFSGAETVAETKAKQPDKKTLAKVKRIVSTYDKIAAKGLKEIPADVQIKMTALQLALHNGDELKKPLDNYIESLKLARAWKGTSTKQVVVEAAKPKGENAGQVADIGTLASRMVSPEELSTRFSPVKVYTQGQKSEEPKIVMGKVTVLTPTIEDEVNAMPEKIQDVLNSLAPKLSAKLGDKAYGKITVQIKVPQSGKPEVSVTNVQEAAGTARDLVAALIANHLEKSIKFVPRKEESIVEFDVELR